MIISLLLILMLPQMTHDVGNFLLIKSYDENGVICIGDKIIYLFLISELFVCLQMKEN